MSDWADLIYVLVALAIVLIFAIVLGLNHMSRERRAQKIIESSRRKRLSSGPWPHLKGSK
jgi:hypothetical protein